MHEQFYIETHGCQMNVYDSRRIASAMSDAGFCRSFNPSEADVIILYTCNVRENAARKVFSNIGMLRTERTRVIALGGCVAQSLGKDAFEKCKAVNIVFGPHSCHKLPAYIRSILDGKNESILDIDQNGLDKFSCFPEKNDVSFSEFVTIQEGCNNFCTYCVVPLTRGRERSRPAADVLSEVKRLVSNGSVEITLLGQNVNSYEGEAPYINVGSPKGKWRLGRLIQEIAEISGLKRLRYTTSHPKDLTDDLMRVHSATSVLAPFVHLPVQSGSDRILKRMRRGHTSSEYLDKLSKFRDVCPNIQFSTDIIVGFPTETDSDFLDTVNLTKKAKYISAFSFKYSRRDGTIAANMDGQIPEKDKAARLDILQKCLAAEQSIYKKRFIGQMHEVLFEKTGKKAGQYIGKDVYMQSIVVESPNDLTGKFENVLIDSIAQNCLFGSIKCTDQKSTF
jgi:tRNA-2-methylthio-N6-dimethylallyladenosine synthase